MGLFEDNEPDYHIDISEDDGLDLDKPKVQIIEDEEETPEQKVKKKKIVILSISGILSAAFIGVLVFVLTLPKQTERVLPYDVANANGYSNYEELMDYEEWQIIETVAEPGIIVNGIISSPCNLLQKPSPYGNGILGLDLNSTVNILGEVIVNDETTDWLYVEKDGIKGYIHEEKLSIEVTEDLSAYLSKEELARYNMSAEDLMKEFDTSVTEDLNETATEIDQKAQIKEMENAIKEDAERQEELQKQLEEQLQMQEQGIEVEQPIQPLFHNQQTNKYFNADGLECDKDGNVIEVIE